VTENFVFSIFPEGGLSGSIITTVGIGVLVAAFYNLRFGWVLAGFIVPGYLVPLIISQPLSAALNIIEGFIAYFVIYWASIIGPRLNLWSSFFGRECFVALLVASVIVRIFFDLLFLPNVSLYLQENYKIPFFYQDNFHSFGLIIIPLIAYKFWLSGFKKGVVPFFIILITSYILIRYGLMEWTNFRISEISFLYDDLSYNFYASYKAYIILLTTVFIASYMNLKYGWEYGGVLVAALLALEWYFPTRIVTTLVDAILVYSIAKSLLKTSFFEASNITRARETILFFGISFLYKLISAWSIMLFIPDLRIVDFYGFGYLLSSLIALKMYNSQKPIRILSVIVQTSFVGVILGTIAALALSTFPTPEFFTKIFPTKGSPELLTSSIPLIQEEKTFPKKVEKKRGYLSDFISERKVLAADKGTNRYKTPSTYDLYHFDKRVLTPLLLLIQEGISLPKLEEINGAAKIFGYTISLLEDEANSYLILAEDEKRSNRHYGATFIFRLQNASPYVFQASNPFFEINTAENGLYLFSQMKGKAFVFSESHPQANLDGSADLDSPLNKNSFLHVGFQAMLREIGEAPLMVVLIRGYSPSSPFISLKGNPADADIFLAFHSGEVRETHLSPLQQTLVKELRKESYKISFVDNTGYLNQTYNKEFSILWLSASQRSLFRTPENALLRLSHMKALRIPVQKTPIKKIIQEKGSEHDWIPPQEIESSLQNYIVYSDILYLQDFLDKIKPYTLQYVIDPLSQKNFLVVLGQKVKKVFPLEIKSVPLSPKEQK